MEQPKEFSVLLESKIWFILLKKITLLLEESPRKDYKKFDDFIVNHRLKYLVTKTEAESR